MHADRYAIFDYAKGIGIILVVYGHVARGVFNAGLPIDKDTYSLVDSVIYSFHMPLFFFISGCFFLKSLEKRGALNLARSKVGTILYPYAVWSLLQGLVEFTLASHTNGDVTMGQIFSLLWQPRAHFWFLYVLFGVFLLAALLYRRTTPPWTSMVLGLAVALYLTGWSPADIYLLNALPHWFVFFALGVSATFLPVRIDLPVNTLLPLALAGFVISQWLFHDGLGLTAGNGSPAYTLTLALAGIAFVFVLGQSVANWNWTWLSYLGRHSLEIYLIHILAGSGARIGLQKILGITDAGVHLVVGTLFGIGVPLLVVLAIRCWSMGWLFSAPRIRLAAA